jgi:sortase A
MCAQSKLGAACRRHSSWNRFLRCIEYGCWFLGGLAVLWVTLVWWHTFAFQRIEAERLASFSPTRSATEPLHEGDLFGEISIPRIGLSAIIAQGTDDATLRRAVGHVPGTASPGSPGTVVLAAHRDTFFRPLHRIRVNDLIFLDTEYGKYRYRVVRVFVVSPRQTSVLDSSPASDLTLLTCFPFRFIGPAPDRFVVQAVRINASMAAQNNGSK